MKEPKEEAPPDIFIARQTIIGWTNLLQQITTKDVTFCCFTKYLNISVMRSQSSLIQSLFNIMYVRSEFIIGQWKKKKQKTKKRARTDLYSVTLNKSNKKKR